MIKVYKSKHNRYTYVVFFYIESYKLYYLMFIFIINSEDIFCHTQYNIITQLGDMNNYYV